MAVKMRLQRGGRKGRPVYSIVIADARAKRDGKFIEKLGQYNPNTIPATISLDADKALAWLRNGAEPTNTVKAILSNQGVLYKKHLQRGVDKGAFTQEVADQKFEEFILGKTKQNDSKKEAVKAEAAKRNDAILNAGAEAAAAKAAERAAAAQAAIDAANAEANATEGGEQE